jgi:ribosomal-protein-alanine N-acetyltransferase
VILAAPLTTGRLALRSMTANDATATYRDWMNDPRVNRFLESRFRRLELEDLASFIATSNADPQVLLLAIRLRVDDRHVGNIKLGPINAYHRFGDIGLVIGGEGDWGRGYAREAIAALSAHAFSALGLHKVTAGCYASNVGSRRAFEACGFSVEGVRRAHFRLGDTWEDVVLLGRLASKVLA